MRIHLHFLLMLNHLPYRTESIPDELSHSASNESENDDHSDKNDNTRILPRSPVDTMQTFVYSATLSKDLQQNLKKKLRPKGNKKHYKRDEKPASALGTTSDRFDRPQYILIPQMSFCSDLTSGIQNPKSLI